MKKCSTFLAIQEMRVKTTLRFHLTPVRMAIIKKTNSKCCEDAEIKEHLHSVGGNVN
jgi:hypothetical protein